MRYTVARETLHGKTKLKRLAAAPHRL